MSSTGKIYEGLNDRQLAAVQHSTDPLLVIAGAGTMPWNSSPPNMTMRMPIGS